MDVWADERALYIWSGDEKADLAPVKAAKLALGITGLVRPVGVGTAEPPPNWDVRVLAIGSRPPWICNYALVSEHTSPQGWSRALSWALGTHDDEKATTVEDVLRSIFGQELREISQAELDSERRLDAYQNRRDGDAAVRFR